VSTTRFVLAGFEELREQLRHLPARLVAEADTIVQNAGGRAAAAMIDAYPWGPTGHLKAGVRVQIRHGKFNSSVVVRSTAEHAYIFENGTQARHTELGANRGAMPPGHVVIPIAIRERRTMVEDLIVLVESEGLQVSDRG
jgi:hypothetical protein